MSSADSLWYLSTFLISVNRTFIEIEGHLNYLSSLRDCSSNLQWQSITLPDSRPAPLLNALSNQKYEIEV